MEKHTILDKIPKNGFLKLTKPPAADLSSSQKTALIRKGNELFNNKNYEQAKKIFLTIGYTDGLSRIGDYYYKNNNALEALRMYMLAPAPDKQDRLIKRFASVVQTWLHEKG